MLSALIAALAVPQDLPPSSLLMDMPIVYKTKNTGLMLSEFGSPGVPLAGPDLTAGLMIPSNMQIGSFSSGAGALITEFVSSSAGDYVRPSVDPEGFSFFLFGVSGTGWAPGTVYAEEAASDSIVGDIFCHVLLGSSSSFPPEQDGQTFKIRDGRELADGGTLFELVDIDSYMPSYVLDPTYVMDMEDITEGRYFYFTLRPKPGTTASYAEIPYGAAEDRSFATIYKAEISGGTFGQVTTAFTYAQMHVPREEIIDGLTVMCHSEEPGMAGDVRGIQVGVRALISLVGDAVVDRLSSEIWVWGTWDDEHGVEVEYWGPLCDEAGDLFVETELGFDDPSQHLVCACSEDPAQDGKLADHGKLRKERVALLGEGGLGDPSLDIAIHQISGPSSPGKLRYCATFQGFIKKTDRYAVLVQDGNQVLGVLDRIWQQGDIQRQHLFFELDRGLDTEVVSLRWMIVDANTNVNGFSHDLAMRVRGL